MFERETYEARDSNKSKIFRIFLVSCGLIGCLVLIIYFSAPFVLFPFPSPNAASAEIIANVKQYQIYYLMAAWLQGSGTFLIVIFALGLVYISEGWKRFAGWITMLASAAILMLSLTEGTFFLGAVQGVADGHANTAITSFDLTFVFLHSFFLAPSILLPLAFVLRWSRLLPKFLWLWALILGGAFGGIGFIGLFLPTSLLAISLVILMAAWMITSSVELLISSHSS
jgi:hypothetical protein